MGSIFPAKDRLKPEDCLTYINTLDQDGKPKKVITGVDVPKTTDMVMQSIDVVYVVDNRVTYIYLYECGGFSPDAGGLLIPKHLYSWFRQYYTGKGKPVMNKNTVSEIVARINSERAKNITVFQQSEPLFNIANGVLNLETGKLLEHSPQYMMLEQSPVIYDPDAECPKFDDYLDKYLDSQYHNVLQEMFGYSMWPRYDVQRAFVLWGPPRTGKGTFLRILQEMLGKDNYSSVNLRDLIEDRFKRAELFGKRANISGDLTRTPIKDPQIFQNLVGGDEVTVEFKFGRPFQMTNTAKLIFGTNNLPRLNLDDDAFYTRMAIIPVENTFLGKEDPSIEAAMKTPEELSGILNWSLEGLKRLRKNGWKLSHHIKGEEKYAEISKPEYKFLEEMCESSTDGYITKSELVTAYNRWAKEHKLPPATSKIAFGKIIIDQMVIPVESGDRGTAGNQAQAWIGIRLK